MLGASTAKAAEETKQINTAITNNDSAEVSSDAEDDKNEIEEMLVGKGLGNCLKVLRDRGVLGKQFVRGRNLDQTLQSQLQSFDKKKPEGPAAKGGKKT